MPLIKVFSAIFGNRYCQRQDLRIQGFDLLHDILGYMFISYGVHCLTHYSEHFKNSMCCSIGLILLHTAIIIANLFQIDIVILAVFQIVSIFVYLLMFLSIAEGLKELETKRLLNMNTDIFKKIWYVQSITNIVCFLIPVLQLGELMIFAAIAAMIGFGANLLYLFHFHKARNLINH